MATSPTPRANEPIAIIGSACHFAGGVDSPSKLWDLLQNPRDVRSEIPDSHFSAKGFFHANPAQHGHHSVTHSYLIDGGTVDFDAEFFGVKPVEAQAIDPQQKMLMETVYEAIEAAGLTIEGLKKSDTGVFVGSMCADFEALQLRDMDFIPTYLATGIARSILANRLSYFFDWRGPSMTIDSACSSSLVAVHQAVHALRSGESRMAVACGSNLILGPENYIMESKLNMLSPDGVGKMWDESANGYARGEGVATLVLKSLSSAIADGDHVECLIRETGVNQDGATAGITMPSAAGQQALIEATYAKAGLDLKLQAHWPQMFEAHGTGTPAGDPVEAEAICNAFFGKPNDERPSSDLIHVGSIKTVLGHTEGTAGIAAILRASLAIQHSQVPPNLHFKRLNPAILPFYNNLEVPQTVKAWPEVSGAPRRASVNSFGFGGTNAHAILESYDGSNSISNTASHVFTPFVFSARSERSLRAYLLEFAAHIQRTHANTDPGNLAYTLRQRRSIFSHRAAYTAENLESLCGQIRSNLFAAESRVGVTIPAQAQRPRAPGGSQNILGIFTGQGAQYPRMGAALIENSPTADRIIQKLEGYLSQLPQTKRPLWSLRAELLASTTSRVHEAAISQPLCTAVQILLVDLLRIAQVELRAVVGHSSGEIAAAYAVGCLTARDAIITAYFRGLCCERAVSPNGSGIGGAMLAVGASLQDAVELCNDDVFAGRVNVAACNSPSSVTISGDADAIEEFEIILDDEDKFHRRLRVDRAYHSPHMQPCFDSYVQSLDHAGVKSRNPSEECRWYSSVDGHLMGRSNDISNAYWGDNMVKPVLFNQALNTALSNNGSFEIALEIGAHPALKGPVVQTLKNVLECDVPYHGTLNRNMGSVESMSICLGYLWLAHSTSVDLNAYEAALSTREDSAPLTVVKGLPSYQWDHSATYLHESRTSRNTRLRGPYHPLLGHELPNSSSHHRTWRNVLIPSEIDWLDGHRVQGQLVFPAAGYITTALEAAKVMAAGQEIRLIEISEFHIHQAVTFDGQTSAVEVLIGLSHVSERSPNSIHAKFTYTAALEAQGSQASELSLVSNGEVRILLGASSPSTLPLRRPRPPHLLDLESERLYGVMDGLGYNFSGAFRSLKNLQRKHGRASCRLSVQHSEAPLLVHPVELDAALQSIMLAYSFPGDGQLRTLHLPTSISKLRVNADIYARNRTTDGYEDFIVDSACQREKGAALQLGFTGHVSMYAAQSSHALLQAEGVHFVPVAESNNSDRDVFCKMDWIPSSVDGVAAAAGISISSDDARFLKVFSRVVSYFLRMFDWEVPSESPVRRQKPLSYYLDYAHHMTGLLRQGKHKYAKEEWLADTFEDIVKVVQVHGFSNRPEIKLALLVGETMPRVFKQETSMIEHMRTSGLLDEYYSQGFGLKHNSTWLSQAVKQITNCFPHLNILEIGAGTGGATKNILSNIGRNFDTYTFTDVSSSFFGDASKALASWRDLVIFKVLDIESSPAEQGFKEGTYDIIVSSFVIHATSRLDVTMRNLRKLLKPGGFLVVGEGTSDGPLQSGAGFLFGPLPGWWRGIDEGRSFTPFINLDQWDNLLRETGFSGIDSRIPQDLTDAFGLAMFVSQAVNDQVSYLREPLAAFEHSDGPGTVVGNLVIVGGVTESVQKIVDELGVMIAPVCEQIVFCKSLEDFNYASNETTSVICLADVDTPVFENLTPEGWQSFKRIFEEPTILVWISAGRLADQPWSNMPVGFGRTALNEIPGLQLQFVDFPSIDKICPRTIAESFLRLKIRNSSDEDVFWTVEPEIVIDEYRRNLVPRLRPINAANERYNSIHRSVSRQVDTITSVVELQQTIDSCSVREVSRHSIAEQGAARRMRLRTTSSLLCAIKTSGGHQFLASGLDAEGQRHLCLVPKLSSLLDVWQTSAMPYQLEGSMWDEHAFLTAVATHMIALMLLETASPGQKVALHNPSLDLIQAMNYQASRKGVAVLHYATQSNHDRVSRRRCETVLAPYASFSEILNTFPASEVVSFAGLCDGLNDEECENEEAMIRALPRRCRRETTATIFSAIGDDGRELFNPQLEDILMRAMMFAKGCASSRPQHKPESVDLAVLTKQERPRIPMTVVDWISGAAISVEVSRLDVNPLFKGDKSYWLCGMSGALGISLCDWMIDRGVRHLVITSRNPKIEQVWLDDHCLNGVTVKIMCCDITDEKALRSVHARIGRTMPPIAGAINGAMVLRDTSIPNMGYDDVMDVINPKVLGSLHLDRIFFDTPLDFFILVSSITCVVGNVGQANYSAANMYMCALAANRRKRGLNAIALNGGAIIGAGYITRETDRALDLTVEKMNLMRLSEESFHQMIAEAVESGYVDSPDGAEITTGLLHVAPDARNIPKWYRNPKLSHFTVQQSVSSERTRERVVIASIEDKLQMCKTREEISLLVEQSFCNQLRKLLLMTDDVSDTSMLSKRSMELGLDSLISVDLRSWFLKIFKVNVPVLKIMGHDTMATLLRSVVESVAADMAPMIEDLSGNYSSSASASLEFATQSEMSFSVISRSSSAIDWESEAALPADFPEIAKIADVHATPPLSHAKVILITGVTGHLGHHLLEHLLRNSTAQEIHCLSVRRLPARLESKELLTDSRIIYHEGDLSDHLLGLSEAVAKSIFARADALIHNGADTSHAKFFEALRATNVGSTVTLARLCLPRRIPMHYISSAGVCIYYNQDTFPAVSVTGKGSTDPPPDGSFGYACSKWVNERFLERLHEQYKLPVCIYRPSTIIRQGVDATVSQAELDWVHALLNYTRKLKAAPKVKHNRGALDLVRTDTCCAGVLSRLSVGITTGRLEYVNQVGDVIVPMDGIGEMDAGKGTSYAVLPLEDWISRATQAGLHPGIAQLIEGMDTPGMPHYPRLSNQQQSTLE